jgi:hypothetical protein
MKSIIKQNTWLNSRNVGWGNGYVLIPEGNVLHGVHYNDIDVDVHGGLTFSELVDSDMVDVWPELSKDDIGSWMIGFDTCHYQDTPNNWPEESVLEETNRLKKILLERYFNKPQQSLVANPIAPVKSTEVDDNKMLVASDFDLSLLYSPTIISENNAPDPDNSNDFSGFDGGDFGGGGSSDTW